jgi:hypothetical protein
MVSVKFVQSPDVEPVSGWLCKSMNKKLKWLSWTLTEFNALTWAGVLQSNIGWNGLHPDRAVRCATLISNFATLQAISPVPRAGAAISALIM